MPLDYVTLGTNNLDDARIFYAAFMPELGGSLSADYPGYSFSYDLVGGGILWVTIPFDQLRASFGNGTTIGISAESRTKVDSAYAAAMAAGAVSEGEPGPRPQYGPDLYSAYIRDLDGNKLAFVHYTPMV